MRKLIIVLCLLILITLVGCSKEPSNSSEPISSSGVSTTTQSETDSFPSSESINTPSSDKKEPSNQEIGSDTTSNTSKPTETTSSKPTETQGTSSKSSSTESTTESQKETVSEKAFSKLSFSYTGYKSSNEPTPYLKEKPIYDILYSGSRAQVGDTLIFKIDCDPADATDTVVISKSDNLSYKISGNTLSITVNSSGAYSVGSLSVSSKLNPSLSKSFRFTIDSAGNPLNDFSSILSEYISYKGMDYCTVEKGYTTEDPSLSITKYSGAPAWDDMISRQSDNWMQKCLWLIDEYKKHSLGKVNFIISPTEIGFSASK